MNLEAEIRKKVAELGFDRVGITTAAALEPRYAAYHTQWLAEGSAARMGWLHRNNDKRFAPAKLLKGAQSVICTVLSYKPQNSELPNVAVLSVSRYALYDDYHDFIKIRLFALAGFIQSLCGERHVKFKACVDAIPLAERPLAQRAGLGFIGRNHCLINPDLGGQLWLGELLTTLPLEPDTPMEGDFCDGCEKCIAACPTGALGRDGSFDARKCTSYLTIEESDAIDEAVASNVGGRLFGCDACVTACPYDKNAPARTNPDLTFHSERLNLCPEEVLNWTQADFEAVCNGSPLQRLGLDRLKRNARLALLA